MAQFKQSVAWWCLAPRLMEPEALVRAAREIGYAGLELVPQQNWPLVRDAGLQLASHGGHASIEHGLNRPENHDRIEREIEASLKLAQEWGIPNLICFSGSRAGLSDERGVEATAEGLRRVARAAEQAGVNLVL